MKKKINVFVVLLLVATLCAMGASYYDNTTFRWVSYVSECFLIGFTLLSSQSNRGVKLSKTAITILPIVSIILITNYLISPYEVYYTDLLKFFGYFCCFRYGYYLGSRNESLHTNKLLLWIFILTPVVIVALFDNTINKDAFFITPNTFVYFGLSMGLLYMLVNYGSKKYFWISWFVVSFYVLICSSLGVVVAIALSYFILNLKRTNLPYVLIGGIVFVFVVMYVDLPLFVRFRDVINVWTSMSKSDWTHIQDVNIYELGQQADRTGERTDTTSSIWRLIHWANLFSEYIRKVWTIPFGLGAGFCVSNLGLRPHNDFMLILCEYGLVVFAFFVSLVTNVYKRMKNEGLLIYFILAMFLYHLSENLIDTFPPNAVLYFVVGWCFYKFRIKQNKPYHSHEGSFN